MMAARIFSVATLPVFGLRKVYETLFTRNLNSSRALAGSTVDSEELKKFDQTAEDWWGSTKYDALKAMNTLRVPLVRDGILSISNHAVLKPSAPLSGLKIIDIGCGGGILSEPLARLGASVTGLDPGQGNLDAAIQHASLDDQVKDKLSYVCDTVENLAASTTERYDAVVCSEVIEHVANVHTFVDSCVKLTKDGGSLFFTTINRTALSYAMAIIGAEYVLNIVPPGTHDWNKFITPKELSEMLQSQGCRVVSVEGMFYNPLTKSWSWCGSSVNSYALHAVK